MGLFGFFALATQSAFFSPAKIGINKELVGSKHLGFASGIQQMTAMLAILAGEILAGWIFDRRFQHLGGGGEMAWPAALMPLVLLTVLAVPSLALAWAIPRVPAQGGPPFSARILMRHFLNLREMWRDVPLRCGSFGVAFFWGFVAFINLWSVKLAKEMTGGGEGFGTQSSIFMIAASLGMAAGFGVASLLLRKRIELAWVPIAGLMMTVSATTLAFMRPGGTAFLVTLALLAFAGAVFLAPLNAWMQDRYPSAKRGEFQSAVNLQDCLAGIVAVVLMGVFEYADKSLGIAAVAGFRLEISFVALLSGAVTMTILRLLPAEIIRLVGGGLIRRLYRIKTVHAELIPAHTGALLVANHVTFADAFFLTAACPRPVRFVMDEAFLASPTVRLFTSIFQTVTIRRDQPRDAIRITAEALKNGDLVCLFPEGQLTRTGTLGELRRGVEIIAKMAGHPLIPVWCDGSWGSIFSFERDRFFYKLPHRVPQGMTVAFGEEIAPNKATIETVRAGMMRASADALARRCQVAKWGKRPPRGSAEALRGYQQMDASMRRRFWANGHQIGQVNALQRQEPIFVLADDATPDGLPSICLTFPAMFKAVVHAMDHVDGTKPAMWVGGDRLRDVLGRTQLTRRQVFYDFGTRALEPVLRAEILHCPCLAMDGIVIAMSMPDPPESGAGSDPQRGRKPGSWGKLLPGWYLTTNDDRTLVAHGPAAPVGGIELPQGISIDAEGFLLQEEKKRFRGV
jgi:acyl-[acyl-carrier-protein]-phospholipid O-acyltransferase/long-chain-fatty-acid--[acyl-carrier-protein] ligase